MSILYSETWLGVLQQLKFVLPKISMSQPSKTGSLDFVKISTAYDLKGDLVRLDHLRKCITTIRGLLLRHAGLSSVKETIKFQINMVLIVLDHGYFLKQLSNFSSSKPKPSTGRSKRLVSPPRSRSNSPRRSHSFGKPIERFKLKCVGSKVILLSFEIGHDFFSRYFSDVFPAVPSFWVLWLPGTTLCDNSSPCVGFLWEPW